MLKDTYVRAKIDSETKDAAAGALEKMGLTVSDAIRMLMVRIADEKRLPFAPKVPNAGTRAAMAEFEAGHAARCSNTGELVAALDSPDPD